MKPCCVDLAQVVQVQVERACVGAAVVIDDCCRSASPRARMACQRALAGHWQGPEGPSSGNANRWGEGADPCSRPKPNRPVLVEELRHLRSNRTVWRHGQDGC